MTDIPRRIRLDLFAPAERAIYDAVQVVEAAGCDVRLTDAVALLQAARDSVADYVDGIASRRFIAAKSPLQPSAEALQRDGVSLISAERARQVNVEGWLPAHDDTHRRGEMIGVALNYADFAQFQVQTGRIDGRQFFRDMPPMRENWPPRGWDEWWKPSDDDPIRNLVKAGALIAAEIDRLLRAALPAVGGPPRQEQHDEEKTLTRSDNRDSSVSSSPPHPPTRGDQ